MVCYSVLLRSEAIEALIFEASNESVAKIWLSKNNSAKNFGKVILSWLGTWSEHIRETPYHRTNGKTYC